MTLKKKKKEKEDKSLDLLKKKILFDARWITAKNVECDTT